MKIETETIIKTHGFKLKHPKEQAYQFSVLAVQSYVVYGVPLPLPQETEVGGWLVVV